jgi:hypothetical protein
MSEGERVLVFVPGSSPGCPILLCSPTPEQGEPSVHKPGRINQQWFIPGCKLQGETIPWMARFSVIVLMSAWTWKIMQQREGLNWSLWLFKSSLNHPLYASICVRVHHSLMSMLKTWFLPAMGSFDLFQKNNFWIKKCWKHHDIIVHSCWFYFNRNNLVAHSFLLVLKDKSVVAKHKLFTCTWIFVVQTYYCSFALTFVYYPCANSCGLVKPTSSFFLPCSLSMDCCCWATVNQHPPVHREGWMVSGQETIFRWVPVP